MSKQQYKPLPDWSEIDPKYKWRAVNADGGLWCYRNKPCLLTGLWYSDGEDAFWGYGYGQANWQTSLEARPEKITDENFEQ